MSWLSKLFGGDNSAMDSANQYLNQIPGVAHQGYDPYVNSGLDASGRTKSAYEDLMNDPTGFINKLMEGYKPSEGYQFQKDQLTKDLSNTAAAGGIAGTPLDKLNQGEQIQGLLSKDMQQFLQNVLGRYDIGLQGEQGIANKGFDASKGLSDMLGNNLAAQSGLAYKNEIDKKQRATDLWSMFGKALGAGAGAFFNPAGTAGGLLAGGLGSSMFGGS